MMWHNINTVIVEIVNGSDSDKIEIIEDKKLNFLAWQ
jgi:hypothetical protein